MQASESKTQKTGTFPWYRPLTNPRHITDPDKDYHPDGSFAAERTKTALGRIVLNQGKITLLLNGIPEHTLDNGGAAHVGSDLTILKDSRAPYFRRVTLTGISLIQGSRTVRKLRWVDADQSQAFDPLDTQELGVNTRSVLLLPVNMFPHIVYDVGQTQKVNGRLSLWEVPHTAYYVGRRGKNVKVKEDKMREMDGGDVELADQALIALKKRLDDLVISGIGVTPLR